MVEPEPGEEDHEALGSEPVEPAAGERRRVLPREPRTLVASATARARRRRWRATSAARLEVTNAAAAFGKRRSSKTLPLLFEKRAWLELVIESPSSRGSHRPCHRSASGRRAAGPAGLASKALTVPARDGRSGLWVPPLAP